jgi:hypothetical protein
MWSKSVKVAGYILALLSVLFGLASALYWWRSSRVIAGPGSPESVDPVLAQMAWTVAILDASAESARLNKTASVLTAIAVLCGAAATFIGNC